MADVYHIPALLSETLEGLNISPDGTYVDVTLGGGGHSRAILARLGEQGRLFSMDQDDDALNSICKFVNEEFVNWPKQWTLVRGNFRYVKNFMDFYGVAAYDPEVPGSGIDGLLADLGVSFHHFDEAERGFSFRFPGPLDMRMNRQGGKTAADVVNTYSEEALADVLYLYGELKNSRQLARRIVARRPLSTTQELVSAVAGTDGFTEIRNDGTTELEVDPRLKKDLARAFQAIRMEVNDETAALREMLEGAKALLKPGGRLAVLTYHSLEDRIVKNFLKSGNAEGKVEKDFYGNVLSPFRLVNRQVITASEEEVERNPRARSAKLRVAERVALN
ncbi:MAG: 16S rRNA (cytosine(1402)-N(4))-methyltransferase RsmH [Paludibacteraceae bacterium]|nr:16S rRNA (cytosine(1402)-N(4))-methyltransferase RsmH [Paludibacteraceae bacterium]